MRFHHVVLLFLLAPIVGIGIVLWFFLPGSVSGFTYMPSEYNHQAQLRPVYWTGHDATVRGYVHPYKCRLDGCFVIVLGDTPVPYQDEGTAPNALRDVVLLPQHESGWHAALRRLFPHLLSAPILQGTGNRQLTVTGRLTPSFKPGEVPYFRPNDL
jgi:hypothetical protein